MTTVSVIIPTYNYAEYVKRAAESAREQEVEGGVEVIVVDDGSTDDTEAVVTALPGVEYVKQANAREGAARNNGASRASGRYLAFLDPDDYYLPGKLAADVARFEAGDEPALVYSRARNVDQDDRPIGVRMLPSPQGDIFWAFAREPFIPMSTVAVRADAFRECGGFGEERDLSGTADWDMWIRLAARWNVGFVDRVGTCIRVHQRNMSSDGNWMERGNLTALRRVLADPAVAERTRGRAGELRSHMYVTNATKAYAYGQWGRSWKWLIAAVREWPPQAVSPRFLGALARAVVGPTGGRLIRTLPRPRAVAP